MANRTERISAFIAGAANMALEARTARLASLHLLDTLAAIVACRDLSSATVARRYISARSSAPTSQQRTASILGTAERAGVVDAVFAGAMTAHAAEINDFIPSVFVQPGPAVVSTAVGMGEATDASGSQTIGALVAGYELAARVPRALGIGNLRRAGIASHGIGPCFGAAATAAALLGLEPDRVADVLSLTAQQAGGSWQWLLDGRHIEKAFVFGGLGARNGVEAALLVDAGYRGVPDVLDRPGTWFTSPPFSADDGDGNLDALVESLETPTALELTAFKRYPVGGPAQPAVHALLQFAARGIPTRDVERVVIEIPGHWQAFRDADMPALNLPYLTAVILLDGRLDFVAAQSNVRMQDDPAVKALMSRVEVRHDPTQESPPGADRAESARLTITLLTGEVYERYVPHVLGYPSHPMNQADVEAKAFELTAPHIGEKRARALIEACEEPEHHRAATFATLIAV